MRDGKLSPKEKAFALAAETARGESGGDKGGIFAKIGSTASRLRVVKVKTEIERLQEPKEVIVSKEWLLREWLKVADSDPA
jgi:hypothetical protein